MSKRKLEELLKPSAEPVTHIQFLIACKCDNINVIEQAFAEGLDINKKHYGDSPLHLACAANNVQVVKILLNCEKVDVNAITDQEYSALMIACSKGHAEIVTELLLHKDINTNLADSLGHTALFFAASSGSLETVKALIKHNIAIETNSNFVRTLKAAIIKRYWDILAELIPFLNNIDGGYVFDCMCFPDHVLERFSSKRKSQYLNVLRLVINKMSIPSVINKVFLCSKAADLLLFERLNDVHWNNIKWMFYGQKQSDSPLSTLHRDLLRDFNTVFKAKLLSK